MVGELTEVELASSALDIAHTRARNHTVVEYKGNQYKRLFLPIKLSKSGEIIRQWVWLLQKPNEVAELANLV